MISFKFKERLTRNEKIIIPILFIFFYSIVIRLLILFISNPLIDDFFITLRVAKNFLVGNGLVYNPGEKVISSTSTIYALINALFLYLFGDNSILVIRIFLSIIDSINAILIFLILLSFFKLRNFNLNLRIITFLSFIGALIYSSFPTVISINLRGLETPIYILFILLSFFYYIKEKLKLSFIFSYLSSITRPDGILVVISSYAVIINKKEKIKESYYGLFLYLVYNFLLLVYYNNLIPQSVIAKSYIKKDMIEELLFFFTKFYFNIEAMVLGIFSIFGILLLFNFKNYFSFLIWGFLYVIVFSFFGKWWPWYLTPFLIFYSITSSIGLGYTINKYIKYKKLIKILLIFCLMIPIFLLIKTINNEIIKGRDESYIETYQKRLVSEFLNVNTTKNEIISLEPLGMIGYLCFEKKFIDYPGLVSRKVTSIWRNNNIRLNVNFTDTIALKLFIKNIKPDYLIMRKFEHDLLIKTKLLEDYHFLKKFEIEINSKKVRFNSNLINYYIYKKNNQINQIFNK